jgi:uncharacterized membrane protein
MIASEILHTFVGCIGLVLVSPLTTFISSFMYRPAAKGKQTSKAVANALTVNK